jgi:hypothetical protein
MNSYGGIKTKKQGEGDEDAKTVLKFFFFFYSKNYILYSMFLC